MGSSGASRWRPAGTGPLDADGDTFATTGVRTTFRGPYSDGPPAEDLEVHYPPLERIGPGELWALVSNTALLVAF
jgi:hypothetical protein